MTAKLTTLPRIEGEARVEGAHRLKIDVEARTEVDAQEKTKGGVWGGARWAPPQKFVKNQTWNHSFWCIFEANVWNKQQHMLGSRTCSIVQIHKQIEFEYLISGNCLILLKNEKNSWGLVGIKSPRSWSLLADKVVIQACLVHIN